MRVGVPTHLISELKRVQGKLLNANHVVRYKDYPLNGAFSFVKFTDQCIKRIQNDPNDESGEVLELFIKIGNFLLRDINKLKPNDSHENVHMWTDYFELMTAHNNRLVARNMKFSHFRLTSRMILLFAHFFANEKGIWKSWENILNPFTRTEIAGDACENGTQTWVKFLGKVTNRLFYPAHLCYNIFTSVYKTDVVIPRINDCEIYLDEDRMTQLRINPEIKKETFPLDAAVFRKKGTESYKNILIFHVQGGSLQVISEFHTPLVRHMTRVLGVTTIVSSYRVIPDDDYPSYVQDLVDAYLFITSGSQSVQDMIGFIPERIIISADSMGGNLALLMMKALFTMESRKMIGPIMRPSCLSFQYPVLLTEFQLDSFAFSMFDSMFPGSVILNCMINSFGITDFPTDWFRHPEKVKEYYDRIERYTFEDEMRNFGFKGRLDFLKGIKLSVICGEFDPILEFSVRLSSLYPEESFHSFDVAFGSTHGFHSVEVLSMDLKYVNLIPYRISQMMDIPIDLSLTVDCEALIDVQKEEFTKIQIKVNNDNNNNNNIMDTNNNYIPVYSVSTSDASKNSGKI